MPSHLKIEMLEDACDIMRRGIKALGLTTGAAKGDIKVTKSGAMIGEIAARLSGGFMSAYTYPLSSGVDLMKAMIEVSLGHEPGNLEPVFNKVAIERAIICKPGVVKKISGLEEALKVPGVEEIFLNIKEGDTVVKPTSNVEKSGNIIAVGDTLKQAEASVKQCLDLLMIETSVDSEISMKTINALAREKFKKICYVCKSCDGYECASGVPGMGGTGTGDSFRRNADALKQFKVITTLIHEGVIPDTSAEIFGQKISFPVMAAPITGSVTNMNGAIEELDYNIAVVKGCRNSGTIAFVGDGATPDKYKIGLEAIEKENGWGIPIFKPRKDNNEIIMRIKAAEKAGAIAAGIDIDAVVFKTMAMKNQEVAAKSVSELMEIKSATKLPFILKGIMNPRDAEMACKAGADAIIVSNHGGRVLDQMPGSMDVLEEIVAAVGKSITIMIDGGFRDGVDVLKAIALGADFVLIGRPVAIAAVGMGVEGTSFYLNQIKEEFSKAMALTGCNTVKDIKSDLIRRV
jgi:isopentenyl diphosphate isomerase/L-lactate dehydrogenase-like FMN-dependent dehydrogenase